VQELTLTNTLSGNRELFHVDGRKVTLYVCGITPYDFPHIGHGRCYVVFDLLYRVLTYAGYTVTYCRNFTDIDDKLLNRAEKELGDRMRYREIAQRYIDAFTQDMSAMGCATPQYQPRVTECMPAIISFIEGLVAKGKAYVVNGDVYFEIATFPQYGKLSKRNIDDLIAGARVDTREEKRNPLDFALWKSEPEGQFWQSPWGWGRPGWHIECSAMVEQFLHSPISIHGGGMDLIFPHHENEIAQSEGLLGHPLSHVWMHVAFITFDNQKMSKSLGNFVTLRDLYKQADPMVVRLYLMQHHFRAPLEFALDGLMASKKNYEKLVRIFADHACSDCGTSAHKGAVTAQLFAQLSDDLNTSGMLGVLFESLRELQSNALELCSVKSFITQVLGLSLIPLAVQEIQLTPEIERLIKEREDARQRKDYQRADQIRDQLKSLGYQAPDKKAN
jgi:cysteinyl-tRNA synthetase